MIEINLLPGSKKKRGAKGAAFTMPDFKSMAGAIKDPWLIAMAAGWVLVAAVVLLFWLPRRNAVRDLEPRLASVQREARRLREVRTTQTQAQAKRDTLLSQIDVIRTIDRERYIWPHILDAVTKALPAYTWLDDISAQQTVEDSTGGQTVTLQLTGKSGDIQAVTRFVRNLEESAFLEGATQVSTAVVNENRRDVYSYIIRVRYQQPDSTLLTMQPLSASLVQGYRSGTSRPRGR